jgi:hypothetical protein
MLLRIVLAALIVLPLVPAAAPAQSGGTGQETELRLEQKRKRLVVHPETPMATAVRDAEQAADQTGAAEIAREANDPVRRRPQLDYDVTSALQARGVQRSLRR